MLTSVRYIVFLHTLSDRDKISSLKCKLKLEMDVNSCHFETKLMEEDFGYQNNAFLPTNTAHVTRMEFPRISVINI